MTSIQELLREFNKTHIERFRFILKTEHLGGAENCGTFAKLIAAATHPVSPPPTGFPDGLLDAFVEFVKTAEARGPPLLPTARAKVDVMPLGVHAWDVAVAVVAETSTADYLQDPANSHDVLASVAAHISVISLAAKINEGRRPLRDAKASACFVEVTQLLSSPSSCVQLFVHTPEKPGAGSQPYEQADVDYALFRGGTDIFGPWHVFPWGQHVLEVAVAPAADPATPRLKLLSVPAVRRGIAKNGRAELRSLRSFVSYYLQKAANEGGAAAPPHTERLAPLDTIATQDVLDSVASDLNCDSLVQRMRPTFDKLCDAEVDPPRGLMLWGPPGTGKTTIAERLVQRCGFAHVVPSGATVAAGEMKGMLQGQTEKNIKALLTRSLSCPWLMFGLVVDEVESLVPNRNQRHNSDGGGGSSALGVVLTWFGESKVTNLFMFAATNLRNRVDEAFSRRLTDKLFVGLPSSSMRREWNAKLRNGQPDHTLRISDEVREYLVRNTVNYSGANMKKLFQDLQTRGRIASNGAGQYHVTKKDVHQFTKSVAESERVLFAGQAQSKLEDLCNTGSSMWEWFDADFGGIGAVLQRQVNQRSATGRVLVNLAPLLVPPTSNHIDPTWAYYAPFVDVQLGGGRVHTMRPQLSGPRMSAEYQVTQNHFIVQLLRAASELDVSCARLVDNAMFGDRGCDDEASMLTILREEVAQAREYDRALLILDLDSALIDVNFDSDKANESIHRKELFGEMLHTAKRQAFVNSKHKFLLVVLMTSYEPLMARATHELAWPMNHTRKAEFAVKRFDSTAQTCDVCKLLYYPSQNKESLDCRVHTATELDCVSQNPEPMMKVKMSETEVGSLAGWMRASYQWRCCKQAWGTMQCTVGAKQHKTSSKPDTAGSGDVCTKQHAMVEASLRASNVPGLQRVWCNFCSRRVGIPQGTDVESKCSTCSTCHRFKNVQGGNDAASAATCGSCTHAANQQNILDDFKRRGESKAAQFFVFRQRRFVLLPLKDRIIMTTHLALPRNLGHVGRWCPCIGASPPPRVVYVNERPVSAATMNHEDLAALSLGTVPPTELGKMTLFVACECFEECGCTHTSPGTTVFLYLNKFYNNECGQCPDNPCNDTSLAHRIKCKHQPLNGDDVL